MVHLVVRGYAVANTRAQLSTGGRVASNGIESLAGIDDKDEMVAKIATTTGMVRRTAHVAKKWHPVEAHRPEWRTWIDPNVIRPWHRIDFMKPLQDRPAEFVISPDCSRVDAFLREGHDQGIGGIEIPIPIAGDLHILGQPKRQITIRFFSIPVEEYETDEFLIISVARERAWKGRLFSQPQS